MASARASLASILTALLGAGGFALADDLADPLAEFGVPGEALSDAPYTLGVGASIAMPLTPDTDLGDRGEEAGITVFYRGESYGAGLFVQGSTEAGTGDFELGGAGLAGMIYGDGAAYFGSASILEDAQDGTTIIGGDLGGTFYLGENTGLTGASGIRFTTGGEDAVLFGLGFGARHHFDGLQLSLGADYAFGFSLGDERETNHAATVSISYHFGSDGYRRQDRASNFGPALGPLVPFPGARF